MWNLWNEGKELNVTIDGVVFCLMESCDFSDDKEIREKYNFNRIEILGDYIPFDTDERRSCYEGRYNSDGSQYGYMVEVNMDSNEIDQIFLLIDGYGWGETDILISADSLITQANKEEIDYVRNILLKANILK